jgi:uncharacterized repeat protein (TIGR01451 family)
MSQSQTYQPYTFSQVVSAITIVALLWWGGAFTFVFAQESEGEAEEGTGSGTQQAQQDAPNIDDAQVSEGDESVGNEDGTDGVAGDAGEDAGVPEGAEDGEDTNDGSSGEDGTNANTGGEDEEGGDGENTLVITGDAVASGEAETVGNTNTTETDGVPVDTAVDNDNDGDADTDMEVVATTGTNAVSAVGGGNAAAVSGNAIAGANIVNVLNTNIYNSNGFMFLLNNFFGGLSLDFRGLNFFGEGETEASAQASCNLEGCSGGGVDLSITNSSNATIDNGVRVLAGTGGNTVSAEGDGTAVAVSGNAYAGANVVNVANTNLVDTNYLLVSFNNFGSWAGDLVLPGADFFTQFFSGSGITSSGTVAVDNTNTASVENNIGVLADTGGNAVASAGGGAVAMTGNAGAATNVVNQVNTNLLDTDSLFVLFRVHGNWSGDVFSTPEGVSWAETGDGGIMLFNDGNSSASAGGATGLYNSLAIANTNTAAITNNVSVMALTGDNKVLADGGDAVVSSGDAFAGANVVNIANTNVVGRNWILAIFNIFGDWSGNIAFGRPDLWLGVSANTNGVFHPGSDVNYTYTISNRGDADATNVMLKNKFNKGLLALSDGTESTFGNHISLGTIRAGETIEYSVGGSIASGLPYSDSISIPLSAVVSANEPDNNSFDNSDEITITAQNIYRDYGAVGAVRPQEVTLDPEWKITKTATPLEVHASADSAVDYTLVIHNTGGPGYDTILVDSVIDDSGEKVYQQTWDLGTVWEGEEITVTYTVAFNENTPPGTYTNEAFVKSLARTNVPQYAVSSQSETVQASVTVLPRLPSEEDDSEVIVAEEEVQCEQYLVEFIKKGDDNNPDEVRKLQSFLVDFAGFTEVKTTGIYDTTTVGALSAFQARHAQDILEPWGIDSPTGYVYYTTQKEINQVYCRGEMQFPLPDEAVGEISHFRAAQLAQSKKQEIAISVKETILATENDMNETLEDANQETGVVNVPKKDTVVLSDAGDVSGVSNENISTTSALIAGVAEATGDIYAHIKKTFKSNMQGLFEWLSSHKDYFRGVSGR